MGLIQKAMMHASGQLSDKLAHFLNASSNSREGTRIEVPALLLKEAFRNGGRWHAARPFKVLNYTDSNGFCGLKRRRSDKLWGRVECKARLAVRK